MGRKGLGLGEHGEVSVARDLARSKKGRLAYPARTRLRGYDVVTRHVEREGRTAKAAREALEGAISDLLCRKQSPSAPTGVDTFEAASREWLARLKRLVRAGQRSPGTAHTYRYHLENHVLPALRRRPPGRA